MTVKVMRQCNEKKHFKKIIAVKDLYRELLQFSSKKGHFKNKQNN